MLVHVCMSVCVYLCVCVRVHARVHMCLCMCVFMHARGCVCTCMCNQCSAPCISLYCSPLWFLRQRLLLNPMLTSWLNLVVSEQGILSLLLHPELGTDVQSMTGSFLFHGLWGPELRSSCLLSRRVTTPGSHPLSPPELTLAQIKGKPACTRSPHGNSSASG